MHGTFTISLDFELHWGVFDKHNRSRRELCYKNTLKIIPAILQLFEREGVRATWATVGSLFARDADDWRIFKPELEPTYRHNEYSSYDWVRRHGLPDSSKWAHFAPDVIRGIAEREGQEIGSHTFSHYYCMEAGQTLQQFEADLHAMQAITARDHYVIHSLVFPRNQFNKTYLEACFHKGIQVVRTNPANWFWTSISSEETTFLRKLFRTGDTYIPVVKRTSYSLEDLLFSETEPVQIPASRLLRPYHPTWKFLNRLRMQRIFREMEVAAKAKECYHLWWHPENFGFYPQKNLEELAMIMKHFKLLKNKYGMKSMNMQEIAAYVLRDKKEGMKYEV